jgi:glycosyltransferase involved in cell wall biosynthesis
MTPLISVVIPTFNRASVLPKAIDSVLSQNYTPLELFVVDDGSTDETSTILQSYGDEIKVIYQQHAGVSRARNTGIIESKGEFIAFLDSDDWWLEGKLERQMGLLHETGLRVVHTEEIWVRNGKRVNPCQHHKKRGGDVYEAMLPLCAMSPSSILMERRVLDETGLFDETLPACEDYDLWLRITSRFQVAFIEEPLIVKTGGHTDQLSRKYFGLDRFRVLALRKALMECPLNQDRKQKTLETLEKKARVYIQGCKKRGNVSEVNRYENIMVQTRDLVLS